MNILFLTNGFPEKDDCTNGIFNYHRYKRLKALGHSVTACKLNHLRANGEKLSYSLDFLDDSDTFVEVVNFYQIPKVNIFFHLVSPLKKIVSKYSIDIVHVHFATQAFAAYLLNRSIRIPYVITAHGSGVERNMTNSKRYARITKKAFNSAQHIIYVSNNLRDVAHKNGLNNKKEVVIYNGVDFYNIDIESLMNRRQLKRVCFVGHLIGRKRAQFLPEIFNGIRKEIPDAEFTIVGDGEYRDLIMQKLKDNKLLSCVRLEKTIPQDEVFERLEYNDLLLLPSEYDGFGCVLIEAMMCGCQVVVSGNGGMPEGVGNVGTVVPDSDNWIEEFSKAVVFRLKHPVEIKDLVSRAKSFNWEKTIKQEIEVYKEVLNG